MIRGVLDTYTNTDLLSNTVCPMANSVSVPLPIFTLDCSVAAPEIALLYILIETLSITCPGTFSSGAGTTVGSINVPPVIAISSAVVPLAVTYAPAIADRDPPVSQVSKMLLSFIETLPSLSTGRNMRISPSAVLRYTPIVTTAFTPSPTNVGISAVGFMPVLES